MLLHLLCCCELQPPEPAYLYFPPSPPFSSLLLPSPPFSTPLLYPFSSSPSHLYSPFPLLPQSPAAFNYYVPYINQTSVRSAIHVGNLSYGSQSDMVEKALVNVSHA